jgi:PAS domain S-box-containing protein
MKILVVEDTEDARILLSDQLSANGYEVISAVNGEEALKALQHSLPDLIISDILMPVMDGFELCKNIKKQPHLMTIPFVFYTATYTEPSDQDFALSLGADRFIIKPEDPEKLLSLIKDMLSTHLVTHHASTYGIEDFETSHSDVLSRKLNKKMRDIEYQKKQLQVITDAMPALIAELNEHSIFQYVNKAYERWFHLPRNEIIGQNINNILEGEAYKLIKSDIEKALKGHEISSEGYLPDLDGNNHYIHTRFIPHRNEDNQKYSCFVFINDLTDRKAAEEENQQLLTQLHHSQKMNAIDKLTGGIAHDFNNQLGIIIGYLDMLKHTLESNKKLSHWIDTAAHASLRCAELTRQLLSFSRNQTETKKPVNINDSIVAMESIISRSVTPKIKVEYKLDTDLWPSILNDGELQDTILNIVINARDAMPKGGELELTTRNVQLDKKDTSPLTDLDPGEYAELIISDTGEGMSKQTQERLFEPFYTTKALDKGTGLGMAMVYGFTKRYGGHIKIQSKLNVGTTIHIYLPRLKENAGGISFHQNQEEHTSPLPGGNETILIVDDEEELLQLSSTYLEDLGYKTLTAQNANKALEVLNKNPCIDLIFSDVVMPGEMNGYELIEKVLEINSKTKFLLTSGFTSNAMEQNISEKLISNLLIKPYRKDVLARSIRHVFDQKEQHITN